MISAVVQKIVDSAFSRMGPALREHTAALVERTYEGITYRRLARWGYRPDAIIDVGAYRGDWSRLARRAFGPVPTAMIEAQSGLIPHLEQMAAQNEAITVIHATLGSQEGRPVEFFEMGTGSSFFPETSNAPRHLSRQVTRTLDACVADVFGRIDNTFMKIDVQGAELEVLTGGRAVLSGCSLVQLELAMLQYNKGAPLSPEVIVWMADHDWFPTEISGFSRPRDRLVQIDVIFAPRKSELRPVSFRF